MSESQFTDEARLIASRLTPLYPPVTSDEKITMLSFSRPSYLLWKKVYELLRMRGYTQEEAIMWLQSLYTGWVFDGNENIFDAVAEVIVNAAEKDIKQLKDA